MNAIERRAAILEAVEKARAGGWKIAPSRWFSKKEKCCCPLGAVIVANNGNERPPISDETTHHPSNSTRIAELLGACQDWIDAFTTGFDAIDAEVGTDENGLTLGIELRALLCPAVSP